MKNRLEKIILLLLIGGFLVLGIYYVLDTPFCKPDEGYHYAYALHLISGNGLPVIRTNPAPAPQDFTPVEKEGHQPPIYYGTVAAIALAFNLQEKVPLATATNPHFLGTPEGNRSPVTPIYPFLPENPVAFTGRFVSLTCGVLALLFAYLLSRLFLPWPLAVITIAFMAFNPQFLFIATSFSNDMPAVATTHAGLWLLGKAIRHGLTFRRGVALGGTIALATLVKLTGLGLFLPLGIIALWQAWRLRKGGPLLWAGIAGALVLMIDGWWFWRNWRLYGNPFATNLLTILLGPRARPWAWEDFKFFMNFLWKAYWLDFSPGGILFAEPWVYTLIGLLWAMSVAGLILALVRDRALRPFFLLVWGWFALVLCSLLSLTSKTAIFMGGGRLLFPAAIAIGATFAVGLNEISLRRPAIPAGIAVLFGIYAVVAPARYLHPLYPRPILQRDLEHPPAHPVEARFGDQFELIGYDIQRGEVAGHPALTITYYWRALKESPHNFSLFIHLETQKEGHPTILTQTDTYPGYGVYPTSAWRRGWIFIDRLHLPLPPPHQPFSGVVLTGLYFLPTMERLPAYDWTGRRFPADAVPLARIWTDQSGVINLSVPTSAEE